MKRREKYITLGQPLIIERSYGAYIYDEYGKDYIDFLMGWGAVITGHGDSEIIDIVCDEMRSGIQSNCHSSLEISYAETLRSIHGRQLRVGYFANGSDATTAGVRIARSYTDKDLVIFTGYHGWHEWSQPDTQGLHTGARSFSKKIKPSENESLLKEIEGYGSQIACVVVELPIRDSEASSIVQNIALLAKRFNFCLIFDEIKSCPRLGFNYGYEKYGVKPDMITYGKALGGGLPFSMLLIDGRLNEASKDTHISATYWGCPVSIAVAQYITSLFTDQDCQRQLTENANYFVEYFNLLSRKYQISLNLDNYTPLPYLRHNEKDGFINKFYAAAFRNGLFLRPNHCWFLSLAHTKEISELSLQRYEKVLWELTR